MIGQAFMALAAALAVLRETLDDRVRSIEEVEERMGLPLLGYTPHVQEPDLDGSGNDRFSALMEAYSSIRASIDFSLPRSKNVLLLTSSSALSTASVPMKRVVWRMWRAMATVWSSMTSRT